MEVTSQQRVSTRTLEAPTDSTTSPRSSQTIRSKSGINNEDSVQSKPLQNKNINLELQSFTVNLLSKNNIDCNFIKVTQDRKKKLLLAKKTFLTLSMVTLAIGGP